MRLIKPVSFVIVGLLVAVLFGCLPNVPKAASVDSVQFGRNDSALSYYLGTGLESTGSTVTLVSVNTVNMAQTVGAPAVCAQAPTSLDLFERHTDGAVWWEHWDGQAWGTWTSIGGTATSDPAAVSRGTGVIDVFVRGTDSALWAKNTTNGGVSWSAWHKIGGKLASGTAPAACAPTANSLAVFVQGTDHALWYVSSQWLGWSGWDSLGGNLTSSPAAVSRTSSNIDTFARGTDGALWQKSSYEGSWGYWRTVGGGIDTGLSQGVANDGTYNYGISTTALFKYDSMWNQIEANPNAATQLGVNHLGDGCCYNGLIYVAGENVVQGSTCANHGWNSSRIGIFNASNLSYVGHVDISAQDFDPGGCGVDAAGGVLWVNSYCTGTCYKYNLSDFSYLGSVIPNPPLPEMQGIKYYGDYLWVTVMNTGVIRMNTNGTQQTIVIPYSKLNGGEIEGLDVKSDYIRVLCGGQVFTFLNSYMT